MKQGWWWTKESENEEIKPTGTCAVDGYTSPSISPLHELFSEPPQAPDRWTQRRVGGLGGLRNRSYAYPHARGGRASRRGEPVLRAQWAPIGSRQDGWRDGRAPGVAVSTTLQSTCSPPNSSFLRTPPSLEWILGESSIELAFLQWFKARPSIYLLWVLLLIRDNHLLISISLTPSGVF